MVPARGDARRRPLGMRRWLLGTVTLALALGVVVMHSLGVGHHGALSGHVSTAVVGAEGVALSLAGPEPGPGAMAMCLAALPLLLLLRRRGGGAWSGGALRHTPRPPAAVPASLFSLPPGGAGPSLSKLCILRT